MKNKQEKEPPVWLVNLLIRERVWRWRVTARVRRWMAEELPWRLRLYFISFLLVGGLGCTLVLMDGLRQRYAAPQAKRDSFLQVMRIGEHDTAATVPRLRRDALLFWRLADSIEADSGLRRKLDSVLRNRPGLADSLQRVKDRIPRVMK
jgi:hypothetical protein